MNLMVSYTRNIQNIAVTSVAFKENQPLLISCRYVYNTFDMVELSFTSFRSLLTYN
jgi:hypothetical protein